MVIIMVRFNLQIIVQNFTVKVLVVRRNRCLCARTHLKRGSDTSEGPWRRSLWACRQARVRVPGALSRCSVDVPTSDRNSRHRRRSPVPSVKGFRPGESGDARWRRVDRHRRCPSFGTGKRAQSRSWCRESACWWGWESPDPCARSKEGAQDPW